ncbi:hypothetical protein AAFC00_006377 [Neodothiora populina]|uniref:Cyclin N-terminal domain-containing protein n=1 Tax=Neodothiora populina TaxID=2781224 RepID=A0ABR3P534_9PEZI
MACQTAPMTNYGYCDTYFVEKHDDDDGIFARAAADRERARAIAKVQQRHMAQELSQLTSDEYLEDVLDHMEHMESETMPDINSIEIQSEIQWYMRPYLLDFLLEAHHAFQLLPETLFLAVNLLDRYCSKRVVYKRHYQLVGCASLLIAAKYGDRKERVPTIRELKSMCCSLYDDDMFTQMEWHVLQTLNWIVGHPTVTSFLETALSEIGYDPEVDHMAQYISEMALYHKEFISVRPSVMARSSLALARYVLGRPQLVQPEWAARYDSNVVLALSSHLSQPSQALFRKYASPSLSTVSTTVDRFMQKQAAIMAKQNAQFSAPSPAPESQAMMVDGHLEPQTPQKPGYTMAPVGVLTPPITPDKDYYGNANAAYSQGMPARIHGCVTPTPQAGLPQQYVYASYQPSQYP